MCGSTRNVARVARPFPSTIKLSITKQERGKGLAGQTSAPYTIDNLYNTRQIDPPGMVRMVFILRVHCICIHRKIKFFNSNIIITLSVNMLLQRVLCFLLYYGNTVDYLTCLDNLPQKWIMTILDWFILQQKRFLNLTKISNTK